MSKSISRGVIATTRHTIWQGRSNFLSLAAISFIILTGIFLRFYHISDDQFLFYDEGMYLGHNREFLNVVANNPPHNLNELGIILSLMFKTALTTAKALWFFVLNLRVFILGSQAWFFARWVSFFCGVVTVVLLYFWVKRYYKSSRIALLSACILLILPSHVFYSRLGMQEALSTLLFLSTIYLYMLKERIHWSFFISALLLVCVYLTNYRMIIAPVFIVFIECFNVFSKGGEIYKQLKFIHWSKIAIYLAVFYGLVFWIGGLYGGVNRQVTLGWMFHQAQDASGKFNPINFLSYPYYVFVLEGFFFACFFWSNIYFMKFKEYSKFLSFGIVILRMVIFSFAAEKGARYLCVVLPFMAVAGAVAINECYQRYVKARGWVITLASLSLGGMIYISGSLALAHTDYKKAVHFITDHDPEALIVSTQPLVEGLFLNDDKRIVACPHDLYSLGELYKHGARYLILDPQAYISWTANGRRFSPPLEEILGTTLKEVRPLQTFPHLNEILLSRFVLDHNEQVLESIIFLSIAQAKGYGKIRIYELGAIFSALKQEHVS